MFYLIETMQFLYHIKIILIHFKNIFAVDNFIVTDF
jgi:hypothetical protein